MTSIIALNWAHPFSKLIATGLSAGECFYQSSDKGYQCGYNGDNRVCFERMSRPLPLNFFAAPVAEAICGDNASIASPVVTHISPGVARGFSSGLLVHP